MASLGKASLNGNLSTFIDISDSVNSRESMKNSSVDNTVFFEYYAANEFERDVDFNSMPSLDIAEWSLLSFYKPHFSLIDALVGIQLQIYSSIQYTYTPTFSY